MVDMEPAGGRLGRYELLGVLGGGSFATVYRARDTLLGREVALKALLPHLATSETERRRFLAEGRAMAALHHPNIVTVYDVGETGGRPFLAMELVQGRPLAERIPPDGLPAERAVAIVSQLASALDALHAAGFVHRDLKADNVLLTDEGRAVLTDFGIALSPSGSRYTEAGFGMGTPESAAPEQIGSGAVGPAADVYALGVLTYRLLTGHPPFSGDTAAVLYAHAHQPPPPLRSGRPGLAPAVYDAVEAALTKDPAQRPASAGRFAELLAAGLVGGNARAPAQPLQTPPRAGVSPPVRRFTGRGDAALPLRLGRGFTTFVITYRADRPGPLTVVLHAGAGREPARLVEAAGDYSGTTAYTVTEAGEFVLALQGRGEWQAEVSQPDVAAQTAATHAEGRGDAVAYLRIEAGLRTLRFSHRAWLGGGFRIRLLDDAGGQPDPLVAAPGTYTGFATRRFPRTGVYIATVRAAGEWTIRVL